MSTDAATVEQEIAHLRALDLDGLRARWRTETGRRPPPHLPKHLLLRVLEYRLQAAAWGDLDKNTLRFLEEVADATARGARSSVPLPTSRSPRTRPGTVLTREWNGVDHRVMAIEEGYAWNGKTFRSLSEVAQAITGTRWSGPRFFGLQQKSRATSKEARG